MERWSFLWPFLAESMVPWSCVWEPRGSGEKKKKKTPGGQVQPGLHFCEIQNKIVKDPDFLFKNK